METRLGILVMSCHWQGALASVQSLGRRGHRIVLVAWSPEEAKLHGQSDFVSDIVFRFPIGEPAEDVSWLLDVIECYGIDLVIPISDHDAEVVALAAERAAPGSRQEAALYAPSAESLAIARDRNATAALCHRIGLPTPRSWAVEVADLYKVVPEWGYPVFLKEAGVASSGVHEVRNSAELGAFVAARPEGQQVQMQEAVYGDLVDVTGICRKGEVLEGFGFRTAYEFSHGGTPPYALRDDHPGLGDYLARIAQALEWTGGIDLDCLQRPDGTLVLLEINPRFSGTVNFALRCGKDLPAGYLALRAGRPVAPIFEDTGATLFVSLEQEAAYLMQGGREARRRAQELRYAHRVADNGFPQDRGYARALRRRMWGMRLNRVIDPVWHSIRAAYRRVLP